MWVSVLDSRVGWLSNLDSDDREPPKMISISFSFKINVPDLDRLAIEIQCPLCRLHTWARLGEFRRRDFVICRGCHANILFQDHLGGLHRFKGSFEQALKEMER